MNAQVGRRDFRFWLWVPAACFLYVLSIGPVASLLNSRPAGPWPRTARLLYAPIIWLDYNTPLRKPIDWYLLAWGVK